MKTISEKLLEVPVNKLNPWVIAALVEYDRERILQNMKQIRLEEEARQISRLEEKPAKVRLYHSHLLT